ncbi:histidine phosphatase family protein [Fructobacillus fructosus]|uniref:Broad specificity phosphatase PhoE (PhoE) n=1 Tax=Fructobacillus fructosus TaxID=1631 RepID=A0ABN9YMI0_9LACO|nr:histidine phosphatase family protein [Fructobacillus fructosus]MBC9118215.1 histidine phosphatase family protein [Fructobacillus fructosus]MBD9364436.1 histidine phosphatase family protein [Leuconostoc mesenteroides]CAK1226080.1 Broad specificity phosphatase PhoE (PhoE) [Fructobacillus fructosus]CAK1226092.1 Broad specificity phosphatase PhoE (PhoE) [Fructobacillus fructosus]
MTTFYFVRHGQTEWNLEKRFQGAHGDSPLLPTSYEDMDKVATFLKNKDIHRAFASPLPRAQKTAQTIVRQLPGEPKLSLHSNIVEVGLGDWEGMKKEEVARRYPEAFDTYRNHLEDFDGEGFHGEGYVKAVQRFRRLIEQIAQDYPDDSVLIVAHGLILTFGMSNLLGVNRADIREELGGLSNTSTTTIKTTADHQFQLVQWNQTDYLGKAQDASTTI